ncbi:MAG: hypothetical protein LQ346_008592, partial [Caloplaca aetnensis]
TYIPLEQILLNTESSNSNPRSLRILEYPCYTCLRILPHSAFADGERKDGKRRGGEDASRRDGDGGLEGGAVREYNAWVRRRNWETENYMMPLPENLDARAEWLSGLRTVGDKPRRESLEGGTDPTRMMNGALEGFYR